MVRRLFSDVFVTFETTFVSCVYRDIFCKMSVVGQNCEKCFVKILTGKNKKMWGNISKMLSNCQIFK